MECSFISGVTEKFGALRQSLSSGPSPSSGSLTVNGCWQGWLGIVFQCDNRTRGKNNRHKDLKNKQEMATIERHST